jgi:hypothetical protein
MASSTARAAAEQAEAAHRLADEVDRLRRLPFANLAERAGTSQHQEMQTASGQSFDLETQIAWDDDLRRTLYVTLNAWATENKAEIAHDEFALTTDGHGGLVGPVRRRAAAEHTAIGREGRQLSGVIAFAIVWIAFGWASAGENHASAGATAFAWANTGLWIVVLGLAIRRWQNARPR